MLKAVIRTNFHDYFCPYKKLGEENFAEVYLAEIKRDGQKVAVKGFSKKEIIGDRKGKESLWNEICIMRKIDSQNVVKLHGVYETSNSVYPVSYTHLTLPTIYSV